MTAVATARETRTSNASVLLEYLHRQGVRLQANGLTLCVNAPAEIVTDELLATCQENKRDLIRLLERERLRLEAAERRGLVIKWAREPGYIALHDPTTGEWHEVKSSECQPSIVESAKANRLRSAGK